MCEPLRHRRTMFYLYFLIVVICGTAYSAEQPRVPPNPCPETFNYYFDNDGTIFGDIIVRNSEMPVFKMEVNVSYIGMFTDERTRPILKLDLVTPKNELLDSRTLNYKLTFSRQDILPRMTQIKFNDRIYCRGPEEALTSAGISNLWVYKETRIQQFSNYPGEEFRPEPTGAPIQPYPGTSHWVGPNQPGGYPMPGDPHGIPPFIPPRPTTARPWGNEDRPGGYPMPEAPHGIPTRPTNRPWENDNRPGGYPMPEAPHGIPTRPTDRPWENDNRPGGYPGHPMPEDPHGIPPFIPPRPTTDRPWDIDNGPGPAIQNDRDDEVCGISGNAVNLITDGANTEKNEFPWLGALYQWKGINYEFRCTVNLIDRLHVVTVASCIKFYESFLVKPEDILLVLGKSSLRQWAGKSDAVLRTVKSVQVNPEYTQYTAHGDLAILTLNEPVAYSSLIKPICMWKNSSEVQTEGGHGTVAGWGRDDNQREFLVDVKKVDMPMVSVENCMRSNPEFSRLVSEKTFCAGGRNGRGPCTGDIGSPFMVDIGGKWYLKGLVSQAIVRKGTSHCNLDEYVVFSDLAKYSHWISSKL